MSSYFDNCTPDIVLKSLFCKYDHDNSGMLQQEEIEQLLECDLAMTVEEAELYSLLLDGDGSKSISFEEFKTWLKSGEKLESIKNESQFYILGKAVDLFKSYDTNKEGTLDTTEFRKLMINLNYNSEIIKSAIEAIDKDSNDIISFPEFLRWLNWVPLTF